MAIDGHNALGLVETKGLVAAIEAADAMVKAAKVDLLGIETTVAALITVQISGETAAVQAAVDAGVQAAARVGEVLGSHVIPRPSVDLAVLQNLTSASSSAAESPAGASSENQQSVSGELPDADHLSKMTVRELRKVARNASGLSIQGREIARANKQQLLDALGSLKG
jgi:microcompartment protein CcmL/EutN